MATRIRHVGLDVHKESITLAVADAGRTPAQEYTTMANDWPQLCKTLKRLSPTLSRLHCCYEAGSTGYELYRRMSEAGIDCSVVAPALVSKQSGNRIKTDRRDATKLAHFLRSGDLVPVYVSDEETEAAPDEKQVMRSQGKQHYHARLQ